MVITKSFFFWSQHSARTARMRHDAFKVIVFGQHASHPIEAPLGLENRHFDQHENPTKKELIKSERLVLGLEKGLIFAALNHRNSYAPRL